jgi:hypothetical protein
MDQQEALDHAPNSPNWGNLEHYRMVDFPDIVEGKYYYFKNGNFIEDYIARVNNKLNNRVNGDLIYKRMTVGLSQDPDTEYKDDQWMPVQFGVGYLRAPLASMNDQAPSGARQFFIYDEDVAMEGGMRRGALVGKSIYGKYNDHAVYKDKAGYYIVQWNKNTQRPYKKHIKGFKHNLSRKTRKVHKKRGKHSMTGGGLVEDINTRLDDPSYILPAGTVARSATPMMRVTPPFFPRKSLRQGRKGRKSRKAKKRVTRRRH